MPSGGASQFPIPIGSQALNITTGYGMEEVANVSLNGLANGGDVSGLVYSNTPGTMYAKVIIVLQSLSPTGMNPNVQIDNGTNYYELPVDTTTSAKRLEFIDIPTSFLTSFTIFNNTGVAFAAAGNTCTVYPM